MYETITRQALPERHYRELLGTALCVFNANNAFFIENILRNDFSNRFSWFDLIDLESGKLKPSIQATISSNCGDAIEDLFSELVIKRNRIIHSFQITEDGTGNQILCTKEKQGNGGRQFVITDEFLMDFIKENEKLSDMLHAFRGF